MSSHMKALWEFSGPVQRSKVIGVTTNLFLQLPVLVSGLLDLETKRCGYKGAGFDPATYPIIFLPIDPTL